jgi:uncharacterized protein DUF4232
VANSEGVRALLLVLLAGTGALLAGCGGGGTTTVTVSRTVDHTITVTLTATTSAPPTSTDTTSAAPACLASALAGTFSAIPGSAGAGQIAYRLRLANQGDSPCFVSGIPNVQLLDKNGGVLPTNVTPDQPGTTTAVRVVLTPGDAATADARFSPDVPGSGEGDTGQCEPKAHTLRVRMGSGTVDAPVQPPTPVCERGTLQFRVFTAAS